VVVNKRIKNRILAKRINVRIEHVKHSGCRTEFLRRAAENDAVKAQATKEGKKAPNMKRQVSFNFDFQIVCICVRNFRQLAANAKCWLVLTNIANSCCATD
jgi:hypothetical protein